ncbi:hypothetical protein Bbelb_368120 [Branchiostoma belcheri]|nr:hypothetical protein Bbelb_368120 [Branchiostoma belcheri]
MDDSRGVSLGARPLSGPCTDQLLGSRDNIPPSPENLTTAGPPDLGCGKGAMSKGVPCAHPGNSLASRLQERLSYPSRVNIKFNLFWYDRMPGPRRGNGAGRAADNYSESRRSLGNQDLAGHLPEVALTGTLQPGTGMERGDWSVRLLPCERQVGSTTICFFCQSLDGFPRLGHDLSMTLPLAVQ